MKNEKRLIDADAVIRKLKNAHCAECNVVRKVQCSACWVNDVLELLDGDYVDAVEVVRCKYCRKCGVYTSGNLYCTHQDGLTDPKPDDFCSHGERREGE